jgi:signal transduction histidine kinase
MGWVIDLSKFKYKQYQQNKVNPQFQKLRWRLLASYLLIMIAIRLISDVLVYEFFAHSLYQQIDQRLLNLGNAASHSLIAIKKDHHALNSHNYRHLDGDGDLDLSWQNLKQPAQSIEWFGSDGQLLGVAGTLNIKNKPKTGFHTIEQGRKIRTLTISAYSDRQEKSYLEGYIRASESTETVEKLLDQLRWGSYIGGAIALGLIGMGGMWLTRQSLKPIEKSYQQLKQFTADASHELRSPLAAIKTSVEVMQTHPERIHPADINKLNSIVSATNQMSALVEDLLFLARTDAGIGTNYRDLTIIPLQELLEDVITFAELKADEKQILINYNLHNHAMIKGDVFQLTRLFTNLIENAIKYTPNHGYINIEIQTIDKLILVNIQDTGIGIEPENLPLIFDRFWRAETARSRSITDSKSPNQKGSGLGLAIAQVIAKRHHGKITVKSKLGLGSCFQVHLPLIES